MPSSAVARLAVLVAVATLAACAGREAPDEAVAPTPPADGGPLVAVQPGPDAMNGVNLNDLLPPERQALWDPGLNPVGGIPNRTTMCASLEPSGADDTAAIQAALDTCPADQVVQLGAGTFNISGEGLSITRSNITLRGVGLATRLVKETGTGYPVIIIGTRWYKYTQPVDLAEDAAQGASTVTLATDPGLAAGEMVTIDQETDDELTQWSDRSPPGDPSRGWFGRPDRPVGQVVEVKSVAGNKVNFTTPLHIDFATAHAAQLVRFSREPDGAPDQTVRFSGIEDLYVYGGEGGDGGGNVHLFATSYSWVKNVESDGSHGASVNLDATFRCELRDSYLHSTREPNPGGGGYGIALNNYAADNLVENNISWNFNKVMVMRTTGGGNVIGYNYMEDGWGAGYPTIVETGLNAAHMTTPHHELFEGNQSFNFDSDSVWGNSIFITVFRNHLTGQRRSIAPLDLTDEVNRRAIGLTVGHWWYSFIGNVLGTPDQDPAPGSRFVYEVASVAQSNDIPMWQLGYDGSFQTTELDPKVLETTIRHGNFDFVTNEVRWADGLAEELPPSLYLSEKPAFFGDLPWPWVTPAAGDQTTTLPSRARFDAMEH